MPLEQTIAVTILLEIVCSPKLLPKSFPILRRIITYEKIK